MYCPSLIYPVRLKICKQYLKHSFKKLQRRPFTQTQELSILHSLLDVFTSKQLHVMRSHTSQTYFFCGKKYHLRQTHGTISLAHDCPNVVHINIYKDSMKHMGPIFGIWPSQVHLLKKEITEISPINTISDT